jgi:tetratricopeptide (TPR) repeat protein
MLRRSEIVLAVGIALSCQIAVTAKDERSATKANSSATLNDNKSNTKVDLNGPDYFDSLPVDKRRFWSKSQMPLKVFIENGDGVPGYQKYYRDELNKAFDAWSDAVPDLVSFAFVDSKPNANIVVHWAPVVQSFKNIEEGGICQVTEGSRLNELSSTDVTIRTLASDSHKELSPAFISIISLSMIGHALGVGGFSPNEQDIIYPGLFLNSKRQAITARDIATVRKLYAQGEESNAVPTISKKLVDGDAAVKSEPTNSLAYYNRALARDDAANYKGAIEDLNKALGLDPKDEVSFYTRGVIYTEIGAKAEAIVDFTKALQLNPDDVKAIINRGSLYGEMGNLQSAEKDFSSAIKLDPTNASAYHNRGQLRDALGDKKGAEEDFNQALKLRGRI